MAYFKTLIEAHELHKSLADNASGTEREHALVVLDCRAQLGAPEAGPAAWAAGHIPTAQHANLDRDLAAPAHSLPGGQGGRHPLPRPNAFANRCGEWGISSNTQVVAYDDAGGMDLGVDVVAWLVSQQYVTIERIVRGMDKRRLAHGFRDQIQSLPVVP